MTYKATQWSFEQPIALVAILFSLGVSVWAWTATPDDVGGDWPWLALAVVVLVAILVIPLTVAVRESDVHVSLMGMVRRSIPFEDIAAVDVRAYRPIRDFGGWGWRFGAHGARAYTMTGNRAVVLTLKDGKEVFLGARASDLQPLADAIEADRALRR